MGFFNLFKKPVIIHDEFFGQLRFIDFKDPLKNYFEGKGYFSPTNVETQYLIQADLSGPTEKQREFYKYFQTNFIEYQKKIIPLIEGEFQNWKENFQINDFNTEFTIVCITIPRVDIKPMQWDIAFTTIHDLDHHVTIDFTDQEPTSILIDG